MIGCVGVVLVAVYGVAEAEATAGGGVDLRNACCRIGFEPERGGLRNITNLALGDECLKGGEQADSPFCIYADFAKEFELTDDVRSTSRTVLRPGNCRLKDVQQGDGLVLTYEGGGLEMRVCVALDSDSGASVWSLRVTNTGDKARDILPSFPCFNGVTLGPDPERDRATVMNQAGTFGPAWKHHGGLVGNGGQMSMQWHAIWDPDSRSAFALIIMDADVKPKQLILENRAIELRYFPPVSLAPGSSLDLPRVKVLVYRGDWRPAARAYRAWYDSAYTHAALPAWFRESDGCEGRHFKKAGPGIVADYGGQFLLDSFRELPGAHLRIPFDNMEYAFYSRGSMLYNKHTDGDNVIREDLGGAEAMRDGIEGVHRYGLHTTLYIEGYIVYKDSELGKSGKAERWSIMHKDGSINGPYTPQGFLHMCPGCTEWQDHLVSTAARLMRETGADGIRLDSLGFYFLPCYNPAHGHATPFGYNEWMKQLLSKVRDAVLAVNPNALLTTEAPVDWFGQWFHGALTQVYPRDLPAMRMAVAPYRPIVYSQAGPVWGSISGFAGGRSCWERDLESTEANWLCARAPVNAALVEGDVADEDPRASDPEIVTRAFHGDGYWAVVAVRPACQDAFQWPGYTGLAGQHREYAVTVSGVGSRIVCGAVCDIESLTWKALELNRAGDDLEIRLNTNWALVVLSEAGGPSVVDLDPLPALHPNESATVRLIPLQGTVNDNAPLAASLVAPGLRVEPPSVSAPGRTVILVPKDARPGLYSVKATGKHVLGMKRFLKVLETTK